MMDSFSETINTESIAVSGDADIGGTASTTELRAHRIIAETIEAPMLSLLSASSTDHAARIAALESAPKLADLLAEGSGITIAGDLIIQGGLTVSSVRASTSTLAIVGDVEFFGRPYVTRDTAGFAVIRKGAREVRVIFENEYLEQPVVNTSISLGSGAHLASAAVIFEGDVRHVITETDAHGFTILLNKPAPDDISFSWIALAVKGARSFESEKVEALQGGSETHKPVPTEAVETPEVESPPAPVHDTVEDAVENDVSTDGGSLDTEAPETIPIDDIMVSDVLTAEEHQTPDEATQESTLEPISEVPTPQVESVLEPVSVE